MNILDHLPIIGRKRRIHARLQAYCTPEYIKRIEGSTPLYGLPELPTTAAAPYKIEFDTQPYDRMSVSDVMAEIEIDPSDERLDRWRSSRSLPRYIED